jgi:hypothetical protein
VTSRIFVTIGTICLAVLSARADSGLGFTQGIGAFAVSTNQHLAQPFLLNVSFTFSGPFHQVLTLPVGVTLARGAYFIVASPTASGLGGGWFHVGHPLSSNLGSVPLELLAANGGQINAAFTPGSAMTSEAGVDTTLEVHGTAAVPEPTTALMLLTGLIGATRLRWGRRPI